jgi:hypothetical protein
MPELMFDIRCERLQNMNFVLLLTFLVSNMEDVVDSLAEPVIRRRLVEAHGCTIPKVDDNNRLGLDGSHCSNIH